MSIPATAAAWLADVRPPARKLILLYMADSHNGQTGLLNPSIATIAAACGLTPSQVKRHLHALKADGLLSVTANANGGRPGQTPHYRLHLTGSADATRSTDATGSTDAQEGAHGCTGGGAPMHKTGSTHATQTGKNRNEPEDNRKYTRKPALVCPYDVPESVWADFLAIRKAKRAPMTATALQSIQREADKAGISIADALATCCERGWQSFQAEWAAPTRPSARSVPAAENFAAKDYGTGGLI